MAQVRGRIFSIRKGSVQWNEEDRLALANLLIKCGYCAKIGRTACTGAEGKKNGAMEYFVEYWKEEECLLEKL